MTTRKRRNKKAGHRSWAARNAKVPGGHHGDIMSAEKRSAVMSRIRGKNTGPERTMSAAIAELGLEFEMHAKDLPGRPDIVFRTEKVAVFIDGDFWHGWRFPLWKHKLSEKWQDKIEATRSRDARNFRKLRRNGWTVVRIWEHQVEASSESCVRRIITALDDDEAAARATAG